MLKDIHTITEKFEVGAEGKYLGLVEYFTALIRSDALKAGDRLPTYVELQSQFGLTANTINRAMIALEQQGLIERRRGSGVYVANPISSTPSTPRTHHGIIGLCGFGFRRSASSFYWMHLIEGIRAQAESAGSQILLLPYDVTNGWEKVDGVLASDGLSDSHRDAIPSQLPIVCLFDDRRNWASVVANEYSGLKQATEHLLELGHRRIAYLHGDNFVVVPQRLKGYKDALSEFGITPESNWLRLLSGINDSGPQFTASGRRDMSAWLQDQGPNGWNQLGCTALLCHNDDTAVGVMQSLQEADLNVPRDVSVVGFDGTEVGEYFSPPLTTVEMPLERMGELATSLLQKQIATDEVMVEHKVLSTHLQVRESTAAPCH